MMALKEGVEQNKSEYNINAEVPISQMSEVVVVQFNHNSKHNVQEFDRQLKQHEAGLNQLTVQEFLDNRKAFRDEKSQYRPHEATEAQRRVRKEEALKELNDLVALGLTYEQAQEQVDEWMRTQAALHGPDMIAGGYADRVEGIGDRRINASIGKQWWYRVDLMENKILSFAQSIDPQLWGTTYLNVKLTYH